MAVGVDARLAHDVVIDELTPEQQQEFFQELDAQRFDKRAPYPERGT